jgi:hypothetical protein
VGALTTVVARTTASLGAAPSRPLTVAAAATAASPAYGAGQRRSASNWVGHRDISKNRQAMVHTDINGWPLSPQDRASG